VESVVFIHQALSEGKRILVEGANALMLDLDFGTYPYVTSSSTSIGGVSTGLGIPPKLIGNIIGVVKAYTTRVGAGPFPTEQLNVSSWKTFSTKSDRSSDPFPQNTGVHFQEVGREYGTTTGRRRRCGWLDLVVLKYSCMINGYDSLNLTKLDVLDKLSEIKVAIKYTVDGKALFGFPGQWIFLPSFSRPTNHTLFPADLDLLSKVQVEYVTLSGWQTSIEGVTTYDSLPENCRRYVEFIEQFTNVPIKWIGVGPGRESMIIKPWIVYTLWWLDIIYVL
jgi:adenylosuccinate synthase